MALKKPSKALVLAKMYYDTYGSNPFYMRGKVPYLDDMIKSKLVEARELPGGLLVIRILEAGKLLELTKSLEEKW
jgi:hypothetical protein